MGKRPLQKAEHFPRHYEAAKSMMADITKLIWCVRDGEDLYAFEKGLIFRPKQVTKKEYSAKYDLLLKNINELIDD